MRESALCAICNQPYPRDQLTEFHDELICPDCLREETVVCTHCGEHVLIDENAGDAATPLCQHCYDAHYLTCARCGRVIYQDDAYYEDDDEDEPYCHACHTQRHSAQSINDYYYKPTPIFHGKGPRFFGVELEIDGAGEYDSSAEKLLDIANAGGDLLYCKHDGSLEDGFELVTHPMSLAFHTSEMPWGQILEKAKSMGYCSHQAGTCGLHVHVNRDAFGPVEGYQDTVIARILYFFEKHWEELLKFSRRTQRQLDQWAARYGYKDQPRDILEHAKKGGHGGRYTCVNLTNRDTIEFRMFRGTLKLNTLIATLQLVDRICDVAFCLTDDEIRAMSWTTFVSGCQTPELVQYLKERRLYVNEPVAAEAEV